MRNILSANNLKVTKGRKAILDAVSKSKRPVSAEEILEKLSNSKKPPSIATIYRTLGTLSEKGILLKNTNQDGTSYYQINSCSHKHYLSCVNCREIIVIDDCPLENIEFVAAKNTGYEILGHNLEILGICPKCQNKPKK